MWIVGVAVSGVYEASGTDSAWYVFGFLRRASIWRCVSPFGLQLRVKVVDQPCYDAISWVIEVLV